MARARQMIHRREDVMARAQREFELLEAAIAGLSADDWARPVPRRETRDPWTVKDALLHRKPLPDSAPSEPLTLTVSLVSQ